MKKIVLRYGIISSIVMVLIFGISWTLLGSLDYSKQEMVGYAGMLLSVSFVFLAIRQYREEELNGQISFLEGLKIGTLVILFPSVFFGLADVAYVLFLNPDFIDNYYSTVLAQLKTSLPVEEYAVKAAEMESQKAMFKNPLMQFAIMSLTVFMIGFVVTLLSAFFLRKKETE